MVYLSVSYCSNTFLEAVSGDFLGVRVGIQPLCVISDDPGVDEAAEIKRFGSELGHDY